MAIKKEKLLEELSKGIQKTEKRNKKVMLSFTESEYKNLQKTAQDLKTTIPNLIRKTMMFTGITDEEKN
jgi:hypothetical protein